MQKSKVKNSLLYLASLIVVILISSTFISTSNKKENKPLNNENKTIGTYIDGEISTTFPTASNYNTSVECYDNNGNTLTTTSSVSWDGNKWVVGLSDITNGSVKCNVYFEYFKPFKYYGWNSSTVYDTFDEAYTYSHGVVLRTSGDTALYRGIDQSVTTVEACGKIGTGYVCVNQNTTDLAAQCSAVGGTYRLNTCLDISSTCTFDSSYGSCTSSDQSHCYVFKDGNAYCRKET